MKKHAAYWPIMQVPVFISGSCNVNDQSAGRNGAELQRVVSNSMPDVFNLAYENKPYGVREKKPYINHNETQELFNPEPALILALIKILPRIEVHAIDKFNHLISMSKPH
jgi:hypothetical protein